MSTLDYNYLAELVLHAQYGDSNAFAELFAATHQKQYQFAFNYLNDEYLAQDALQETYILALKNISRLQDPTVIVAWLNQLNFRICYNMKKQTTNNAADSLQIESKQYMVNQVLKLPFTESQVIILKYYLHKRNREIARFLDINLSSVNRYLHSGRLRLQKILQE